LGAKMRQDFLNINFILKDKILKDVYENTLLFMIYAENKSSADYARR
jgi:hypothetical protein